ncbi:MAG TPA: hypothetical protein VFO10_13230 [Oligoflexus sp.]|uniref:hypothetical protein n=1 Tax=Oligoflexus sp. TaxID=1971216 RepID=UPI002D80ABFB|nr:hypothetical protein [Oligoflexus sp.]HET9238216.1 hypothetical protein [Oligoflexus sp.]
MLFRSLVYGLLAHLIIGWAFFFFLPSHSREIPRPRVPVEIHFTEKPAPSAKGRGTGGARAPGRPRPASAPTPSVSTPQTTYADLLPKARQGQISLPAPAENGDAALLPGQDFKAGTTGVTKQKLMVDASILSGALDVPLHARRISTGSEAFLRIVRLDGKRLKIVALRGDPMLRAVLFENLQESRIRALILELMDALEEDSLPLTLKTLTGAAERLQDETDVSWIGRRLIIRKSAPPQSRAPAGALTLPDEDAKKAVIRDRLEFERFQRSPAYRSAIQNHDLPSEP